MRLISALKNNGNAVHIGFCSIQTAFADFIRNGGAEEDRTLIERRVYRHLRDFDITFDITPPEMGNKKAAPRSVAEDGHIIKRG